MMSSDSASGDVAAFPGAKAQYTETLSFLSPSEYEGIPIYRVMNRLVQPDCIHSSLFYKQPFYKQPGSNSWIIKQFWSNCRGWNCLETKQSDAEAIPQLRVKGS